MKPMENGSTKASIRLRRGWRALLRTMVRLLFAAWPAPDEPCEHGYGYGYCPEGCDE